MKIRSNIIGNLSIAFVANLISLIGSAFLTLILPKFIGVTQYSYYQLYIFYASYVGFLGFGWIEGIYLKYGGAYYNSLDKKNIKSQFRYFTFFETLISIAVILLALISKTGLEKKIVFFFVGICVAIYLPRAFLHNLLQTTGEIKKYAYAIIIEKSSHIIFTGVGIISGEDFFQWFILSELIGRLLGGCYIFYSCRDIVFAPSIKSVTVKKEIKDNIVIGLPLMLSNVASMLVIGIIRQGIEMSWSVETFGKLSLTLSISNLLMLFINSISMVIFPVLKRIDKDDLKNIYETLRNIMMPILFFALVLYYPMRVFLSYWLPKYSESLKYMAILFPLCIYESKTAILITTYIKVLRKERYLLLINLGSVLLSSFLAYLSCFLIRSLDLAVASMVIVLGVRSIIGEIILKNIININIFKDMILETFLSCFFIFFSWFVGGILGMCLYLCFYIAYILIKAKRIKVSVNYLKKNK